MTRYYDDNFGDWRMKFSDPDHEDTMRFYRQVQAESVEKQCQRCGRTVKLRPHYVICDSCCRQEEAGVQW